ncbi:hypothetical protein GGX14DRAFT_311668, partial [Mycena pura]
DEFTKTVKEANLLFWGTSLFQFTYSFIDNRISKAAQPPPFSVPRLRFVFGGVAVVHEVSQGATAGATTTICRAYLVEEFMAWGNSEFMKFVHNGNAVPLLDEDDPLYDLAQFLCFTQHVQYEKSGGLVFISDYQGFSLLSLFSAIKTEEGDDPFGEGNVGSAFLMFPKQHICNHFCKWFKLSALE